MQTDYVIYDATTGQIIVQAQAAGRVSYRSAPPRETTPLPRVRSPIVDDLDAAVPGVIYEHLEETR